jgi:hypothetical protein
VHVEPSRVNEVHDRRDVFAGAQTFGKQPIVAADRDRADLVLNPVVIDGSLPSSRNCTNIWDQTDPHIFEDRRSFAG